MKSEECKHQMNPNTCISCEDKKYKNTSNANVYILRCDNSYDFEIFGSITEVVNYFYDTIPSEVRGSNNENGSVKKWLRSKIARALKNSTSFNMNYKEYFIKQRKMKVECRLHR